jgi:predicted MFS family arabinose efflux permease
MSQPKADSDVRELESANLRNEQDTVAAGGFAIESDELPKGYFLSPRFIGTFFAVGMNLLSSTGGFALIAPVLAQIDIALSPPGQPSPSVTWLALVYTIGLAVGLTLVGRLSDIFGRR